MMNIPTEIIICATGIIAAAFGWLIVELWNTKKAQDSKQNQKLDKIHEDVTEIKIGMANLVTHQQLDDAICKHAHDCPVKDRVGDLYKILGNSVTGNLGKTKKIPKEELE